MKRQNTQQSFEAGLPISLIMLIRLPQVGPGPATRAGHLDRFPAGTAGSRALEWPDQRGSAPVWVDLN